MKITRLQISDFKSIEELEVQPSNINIITGRNNTGKTTLLESVNLVFNPTKVSNYGENVSKLINVHSDSSLIECEYIANQSKLSDYSSNSESGPIRHQSLAIRRPKDREILEHFKGIVREQIDSARNYASRYLRIESPNSRMNFDSEDISEILQESLRESLSELPEDDIASRMRTNCVVLEIDGEEYPYLYLGEGYRELRYEIIDRALNNIEIPAITTNEDNIEAQEELPRAIRRSLAEYLRPPSRRGGFTEGEPPSPSGVNFVQPDTSPPGRSQRAQENAAIRMSDIEQYLKENKFLDNLSDFSFDTLVFDQNGEKYEIPYDFMGDGFKTIVSVLWEVFNKERNRSVLLLEEAETHMHPGYGDSIAKELVDISISENIQLFITTHDSDFIDAFLSDAIQGDNEEYLSEEFQLIQITEQSAKVNNYQNSIRKMKDLHLDLRGI